MRIALMPVIADRIRKDVPVTIECRGRNGSPNLRVALQTVFGVFIPEVEGAI